jgi:hypothetical protein
MSQFISKETVLKKVSRALKRAQKGIAKDLAKAKKRLKKHKKETWLTKDIASLERKLKGYNALPGLPFRVRSGLFHTSPSKSRSGYEKYSKGTGGFDPETGRAHSFEWYDLGRVFAGQYVVNSYCYSQQTRRHYYSLCDTLKILGVKYIEVEAPSGLQDLDAAMKNATEKYADMMIKKKYARTATYFNWQVRYWAKQIDILHNLGAKSQCVLKAIRDTEKDRARGLANARSERIEQAQDRLQDAIAEGDLRTVVKITNRLKRAGYLQAGA